MEKAKHWRWQTQVTLGTIVVSVIVLLVALERANTASINQAHRLGIRADAASLGVINTTNMKRIQALAREAGIKGDTFERCMLVVIGEIREGTVKLEGREDEDVVTVLERVRAVARR